MFLETNVFNPFVLFAVILFLMKKTLKLKRITKILYLVNLPEDLITKLQTDSFTAVRF